MYVSQSDEASYSLQVNFGMHFLPKTATCIENALFITYMKKRDDYTNQFKAAVIFSNNYCTMVNLGEHIFTECTCG